jgi:hypothetical protein
MNNMRSYLASPYAKRLILRDVPGKDVPQPVQTLYLNEVVGLFLKTFIKVYGEKELSETDKANLQRYLDKVIEAKDALDGKFKEGKEY